MPLTREKTKLNTEELEAVVDAYPGISLRKTKTKYEAQYETASGRHLAIERRSQTQFKIFLEASFDPSTVTLSNSALIERLSKETTRIHLSTDRLAGPYKGKPGIEAWLLRLSSERDLLNVLQSYGGKPKPVAPTSPAPDILPVDDIQDESDESAFAEGKVKYALHRKLERDSALAIRAKAGRLKQTGKLECEVCCFDFSKVYGRLGIGFIEAHHTSPVSTLDGESKTKIESLSMVCSNCHRMLHRSNPMLSPTELRAKIGARQA